MLNSSAPAVVIPDAHAKFAVEQRLRTTTFEIPDRNWALSLPVYTVVGQTSRNLYPSPVARKVVEKSSARQRDAAKVTMQWSAMCPLSHVRDSSNLSTSIGAFVNLYPRFFHANTIINVTLRISTQLEILC